MRVGMPPKPAPLANLWRALPAARHSALGLCTELHSDILRIHQAVSIRVTTLQGGGG